MIPQSGTSLEFKSKDNDGTFGENGNDPKWEGLTTYYIHSAEARNNTGSKPYLDSTSLNLESGASKQYGFTFHWADSYSDLRDILYEAGIVDAVSLPGMVIPNDMKTTLAVRCQENITGVNGDDTVTVEEKDTKNGYKIYEINFSEIGTKNITVHYGENKESVLQYYITKPIEELVEANTDFIVNNQQAKTNKEYNGAYLQWDMERKKLLEWRVAGNTANNLWMYGGSDDLGLSPAVYLSEKNITSPNQEQINSLETYLRDFIWEHMQNHDSYKVYHWYNGNGIDTQSWRSYNYVHVANTYYNMYQIAKNYPDMVSYLGADDYLLRCYHTLEAYFTYNMFDGTPGTDKPSGTGGKGAYKFGNMGEMNLPGIVNALETEGHQKEQQWLQRKLNVKAYGYIFDTKYPFASEMSIDTTGFETCYTLAKLFDNKELVDKVTKASLACRGMQPLWYFYGSDNRHMGESWWNLGYETQIGAWQQQDYLYTYLDSEDPEFDDIMRGTYGAYLAGWANINVGQISDDEKNYGAASWQYVSDKCSSNYYYAYNFIARLNGWFAWSGESCLGFWGGLKTASANIVDDEIVGLYGYGCNLDVADDGTYTIMPKDGVRTKLTLYNKDKFTMEISKARYTSAKISDNLSDIEVVLENVAGKENEADIIFKKLPAGEYNVIADGKVVSGFISDGTMANISVNMPQSASYTIKIEKKADKTALQEAINSGKAIEADGYTEESYAELTKALEEGQEVLDNADASQTDADNAAQAIRTAISGLKLVVPGTDKTALQEALNIGKAIKADGYTEESYAELTKALEEGQEVLDNADASQEDADNAAQAIRTAISGLKRLCQEQIKQHYRKH